jgi:nucleoside triphosphate pyrophosphatase
MKRIILASASPRRKHLLELLGLQFEIVPSSIEEKINPRLSPRQQVEVLSQQKAEAVSKKYHNTIILAADTMVALGNEVIGKPRDEHDAIQMLRRLSGTKHAIVTGFTLIDLETGGTVTKSTETKIWFRKITIDEITAFIKKEKPFDKAGAYAVNELAAVFVEKIEGDFFGAVGLPVFLVAKELKKFGISVV